MSGPVTTIGLLAAAVADRDVPLEPSARGVHTDGVTLYLPVEADLGSPEVAHAVLCQAALLATGSLAPARMKRLARSGGAATERYLALEVVRSCAVLDHVLPGRLRAALAPYGDAVGITSSADESLARALSGRSLPRSPAWFGELHPRLATRGASGAASATTDDELTAALQRAMVEDEDDGDETPSRIVALLSSPMKNPLGTMLMNLLGAKRSAGDGADGAHEIATIGRSSGVGVGRPAARPEHGAPGHRDRHLLDGHRYPEWDHRRERYREGWCTVTELDPAPGDAAADPDRVDLTLLRQLAGLSRGCQSHRRQPQGGELDLDALVEHRTSLRSGTSAEPSVYRDDLRTRPDLSVLVLLDATGSTAEHAGDSSLFESQRRLAAALTTAFDQLGTRVATFAFYSRGRAHVRFLRCKAFDDRWGVAAQRRLAALEPAGFTRLGAALRHGTHVLATQGGTQRRLLVVVGDGIAYDDGYEGPYAAEDSRRAVAEAADRGVACVAISAAAPSDGQSIWPPDAHRVAAEPHQLAREVHTFFRTALHTAERPRRGAAS